MKTLLILLAFTMSAAYAGPRVTGNGGGGIKRNGVYKTFYSAGVYIDPEEVTDIPGADLYTQTISTLSGAGSTTSSLLSAALPIGNRKFYNIAEDKMDDKTMGRLIEEYARVVNQPAGDLTLFAITEIQSATTYLLPSFYKLSENEQASILFHEAYWLLNPRAEYSAVVRAEMAFQEFLEVKAAGKYSHKLPRLLGKLLGDDTLSLKTAYEEDRRAQTVKNLIDKNGKIKIGSIFLPSADTCKVVDKKVYTGESIFGNNQYRPGMEVYCNLTKDNLQDLVAFQQKNPKSFFLQELVNYITTEHNISLVRTKLKVDRDLLENLRNETIDLRKVEYKTYVSSYTTELKYPSDRNVLIIE